MKTTEPTTLLMRYLSGEATAEEQQQVDAWRTASAENQRSFDEFVKVWEGAAPPDAPAIPDVDESWSKLEARLGLEPERKPASVVKMKRPPRSVPVALSSWGRAAIWAAAAAVILALGIGLFRGMLGQDMRRIATANAEQELVLLPDGSQVRLNSGSEIRFSRDFADSVRYVSLTGEAFFEVQSDGRPFEVRTANALIRVLGTSFTVWARNEETRVIVQEGRVAVASEQDPAGTIVELRANQITICVGQRAPETPESVDSEYLLGWLEGRLVFRRAPLSEVAEELGRRYDVDISLARPDLADRTLTGSFAKQPVESALAAICRTMGLEYAEEEGGFVVAAR